MCNVPLILVWHIYTVSAISILDSCVFVCMNWLFIAVSCFSLFFFCCRGLSVLQGKCAKRCHLRIFAPWWNTSAQLVKLSIPQRTWLKADEFCESQKIAFFLAPKCELLKNNQLSAWMRKGIETQEVFHFSWVYTFSAMFTSLWNWASNLLQLSTPAQMRWSSSRPQPLQKI